MQNTRSPAEARGFGIKVKVLCGLPCARRGIIERNIAEVAAGRQAKADVLADAVAHFRADFLTAATKQGGAWPNVAATGPRVYSTCSACAYRRMLSASFKLLLPQRHASEGLSGSHCQEQLHSCMQGPSLETCITTSLTVRVAKDCERWLCRHDGHRGGPFLPRGGRGGGRERRRRRAAAGRPAWALPGLRPGPAAVQPARRRHALRRLFRHACSLHACPLLSQPPVVDCRCKLLLLRP
jgi:hypothetical protein